MQNPALEASIAEALLSIGAVALQPEQPFTWASGMRSPIYCDNRLIMGHPDIRALTTDAFKSKMSVLGLHPDVIAGTATAGIPHAAWLADALSLPMVYVRSSPKAHGRKNQVEGSLAKGQSVVVIEDLISTGMSSVAVVDVLKEAGVRVEAVLAIFSYGFDRAEIAFEEAGVACHTLTNFNALLDAAKAKGHLGPDAIKTMQSWQNDPQGWSDAFIVQNAV